MDPRILYAFIFLNKYIDNAKSSATVGDLKDLAKHLEETSAALSRMAVLVGIIDGYAQGSKD